MKKVGAMTILSRHKKAGSDDTTGGAADPSADPSPQTEGDAVHDFDAADRAATADVEGPGSSGEGVHGVEDVDSIADAGEVNSDAVPTTARRRPKWSRAVVYGVLPALAMVLVLLTGFFKWQQAVNDGDGTARIESLQVAKDSTVALLSYKPDTVEQQLDSARGLLVGEFRDDYAQLITDVVIPGAKQKQISVDASVPAAASVSADENRAVALVFVNQRTVVGTDPPTDSTSSVRVTMDKVDGRWLIAAFDPV